MKHSVINNKWQGISVIISVLAMTTATFFMVDQEFTSAGGIMMIFSVPFGIFGFSTIYEKFRSAMPAYTNWGFLLYLFGAVATVNFGLRGVFSEIFVITMADQEVATVEHPAIFTFIFFAIGPAFPLSILLLGINLYRKKLAKRWISVLLIIAAILFPPSRISRIDALTHV